MSATDPPRAGRDGGADGKDAPPLEDVAADKAPSEENPEDAAAKGDSKTAGDPPPDRWTPRGRPFTMIVVIVLMIIAIIAILAAWRLPPFSLGGPRTDNAFVHGFTTMIAPQVNGYVESVLVESYASVVPGQLLVKIEDSTYRANVAQSRASLDLARANLANNRQALASAQASTSGRIATLGSARAQFLRASEDLRRANALVDVGGVSVRERDQTLADEHQSAAQVRTAETDVTIAREQVRSVEVQRAGLVAQVEGASARLAVSEIDLAHTRIYAPLAGQLGVVDVNVGALVSSGTQLFTLVPPPRWIDANYKEEQTKGVRTGQRASFTVDALGGDSLTGVVERIAPATGSEFAAIKPDNATGNYVKVPQRIGVRIAIDANQPRVNRLRPGMSVELHIDTTGAGSGSSDASR